MLGYQEIVPSRSVCRSLFGPVDHSETKKKLARELDILQRRQTERWNFDFAKEIPLAGKFTWEKVTPDDARVPVAYRVMLSHLETPPRQPTPEVDQIVQVDAVVEEQPSEEQPEVSSQLPTTSQEQQQVENETTPPAKRPSRKRKRTASGQSTITGA